MTQNRELQYSPVRSSDSPMAAKATTAMAVAPNSGHWFCAITSRITWSLSSPASIRTLMPSVTTIALSVSMHRAMMRAPREMRSIRRLPSMYITRNVPMIVRNRTKPIMKPALRPIAIRSTTKTMRDRLDQIEHEALVASVTAVGWKLISPISMPIGWSRFSSSSFCRTAVAHRHDVAALHRRDAQADGRLAVVPEQAARRIFVAALDRRDVA